MRLLVGLGNPGPGHAGNRHNIGFMVVDAVARHYDFGSWRTRFHGLVADGRVGDVRVLALKPATFVNRSGQAVAAAARYHRIPPGDIVVVHDELDLRAGKVRVKRGGGSAGHNGLRDIDAHLGPEYWRLRVGIGHPGDPARVHAYVLRDFAKAERDGVGRLVAALVEHLPLLMAGHDSDFMSRVAMDTAPPRPPKPPKPPAAGAAPKPPAASGPEPDDGV